LNLLRKPDFVLFDTQNREILRVIRERRRLPRFRIVENERTVGKIALRSPINFDSPPFRGFRHGPADQLPKVLTGIDDAAGRMLFALPSPSRCAKPAFIGRFHSQPGRRDHAARVLYTQVPGHHQFRRWLRPPCGV